MKDKSYGIIPVREKEGQRELLLVKHRAGHWAFPKGHPEKGESIQESALRELKEETALTVRSFLQNEPVVERYSFERGGQKIEKEVYYFVALVEGEVHVDQKEIVEALWFTPQKAHDQITFNEGKKLIDSLFL